MAKENEPGVDEPVCGTAVCYELYKSRKSTEKSPFMQCAASDFMIIPGYGTDLAQLRQVTQKRARTVNMKLKRKKIEEEHGAINWQGGSLDD